MTNKSLGTLLVALQFAILAVQVGLVLALVPVEKPPPSFWLVFVLTVGLGLWALGANQPGNFNIRPTPKAGGRLIRIGPYRWIRHPMYTSVMMFSAVCSWYTPTPLDWGLTLALVAVLWAKASLEERLMCAQHVGYAEYMAQTKRFVPWVV